VALTLIAPAKINLCLDVVGRREDGYHLLRSLMQTIDLCDEVRISESADFALFCDAAELPCDESNLAFRAWRLISQRYGIKENVRIDLKKRIPMAAGLAGGSTDCAAVLVGVNKLFGLGASAAELQEMAATMGSDIPFCVTGGTALAEGVGSDITLLSAAPELFVVVVNDGVPVSTPMVYKNLDLKACDHPDVEAMLKAVRENDAKALLANIGNSLEQPAFKLFPALAAYKQRMNELGLVGLLSGSGGTTLGLTEDREKAEWAAKKLAADFKYCGVHGFCKSGPTEI